MQSLNEALLASWVRLSTAVVNNRFVSDMPYNDSLVCHILYRNTLSENKSDITATELCEKTNILKSQMNRILNRLEEKNLIKRIRSQEDKRQVLITFNLEYADAFKRQHEKLITLLDAIIDDMGIEKAKEAIGIFTTVSKTVTRLLG